MFAAYAKREPCIPVNDVPPPPYSFLSRPPQQKKRPTQGLPLPPLGTPPSPSRRRSNTVTAIANWAQHVQPGSPPPQSPRSSVSSTRRPSITRGRRPSIASVRLASGSFLNILDTPSTQKTTPSIRDFKADLTAVGYTSVFVQLSNRPSVSAALPNMSKNSSAAITDKTNTYSHIPIPPIPTSPIKSSRTLKRFRSLSILRTRPRSKSTVMPSSPTKAKGTKAKASAKPSNIVNHKKTKYATVRPAPLANELALMQFADGGNMDSHAKRVMEAQAQAAGNGGVGDVYRDGQGGIWWDAEEEWEYAHLLGGEEQVGVEEWVEFREDMKVSVDEERRGSVSTQDSGLDVRDVVQPAEEHDDLATFGSATSPLALQKPGMSVLSRPKPTRKSDYDLDVAFPSSPVSPISQVASCPSPTTGEKPKGKARRRPAPLKLSPPAPTFKCPHNSPLDPEVVRKDFLENSFSPLPPTTASASPVRGRRQTRKGSNDSTSSGATIGVARGATARKASMMNVRAFFRSGKKHET